MNSKTGTDKYEAQRALNELDERGASWATDSAFFPRWQPKASDDTVPMLPALLRPQAE